MVVEQYERGRRRRIVTPFKQIVKDCSVSIKEGQSLSEQSQAIIEHLLRIGQSSRNLNAVLEACVKEVKRFFDCEAVGVRLLDQAGGIPYQCYEGFPRSFYDKESPLSVYTDRCMCIDVILGRLDSNQPFVTDRRSFYMNGTSQFLATVSEEDKGETRNTCNEYGYESVALVPIVDYETILGLIQVADSRENKVPLEKVKLLERIALHLGDLIGHFQALETLEESEIKYRTLFESMVQGVFYQRADGILIDCNPALLEILGLTREQFIGKTSMDAHWKVIYPDGSTCPAEAHPSLVALQTGRPVRNQVLGVFNQVRQDYVWLNINAIPQFRFGEDKAYQAFVTLHDITERKQAEGKLKKIEWLLTKRKTLNSQASMKQVVCTDVSDQNVCGIILGALGQDMLVDIVSDCLDLLDTSAAVYEANGDYALEILDSGYCQFLNGASRQLCDTSDTHQAMISGVWRCHESCWTRASKKAIASGQPVDIECFGGIRLYAVPIWAGQEVVGSINIGYGDPPIHDEQKMRVIAETYQADFETLMTQARQYESRPPYIIDLAMQRVHTSAKLIGAIVAQRRNEEKLNERRNYLRSILTSAPIGVGVLTERCFESVNPYFYRMTGYSPEEAIGKNARFLYFSDQEYERVGKDKYAQIKVKGTGALETTWKHKDGHCIDILLSSTPLDRHDWSKGVTFTALDISEIKQQQLEIQRQRDLAESIVNTAQVIILVLDRNGCIVQFNPYLEMISGYHLDEVKGLNWFETFLPECDHDHIQALFRKSISGQRARGNVNPIVTKEGQSRQIEWYDVMLEDADGSCVGLLAVGQDITERIETDKRLQDYQQRLKQLATELTLAEEKQNQYLAEALHDGVGQNLAFTKLKIQMIEEQVKTKSMKTEMSDLRDVISDIMDSVRTLTFSLNSPELSKLGFERAIRNWLSDQIAGHHPVKTQYLDDGRDKGLQADEETILFRCVRELVINAVKHAHADLIQVCTRRGKNEVVIEVKDDGCGFDAQKIVSGEQHHGFGLFSVQERLEQMNGTFQVKSLPGQGSQVELRVPVLAD